MYGMFSYLSSDPLKFGMHYHFALEKLIIYKTFKCKLKCHYFELAFCDVPDPDVESVCDFFFFFFVL